MGAPRPLTAPHQAVVSRGGVPGSMPMTVRSPASSPAGQALAWPWKATLDAARHGKLRRSRAQRRLGHRRLRKDCRRIRRAGRGRAGRRCRPCRVRARNGSADVEEHRRDPAEVSILLIEPPPIAWREESAAEAVKASPGGRRITASPPPQSQASLVLPVVTYNARPSLEIPAGAQMPPATACVCQLTRERGSSSCTPTTQP